MRLGEFNLTVRHFLPAICVFVASGVVGAADERFPNELNSLIDEPKILLPDSTPRDAARLISLQAPYADDPLVKLVIETREAQRRRLLTTSVHTPWQIMHGLLALRRDFIISHDNKVVSGLDWISSGPKFRDEYWFERTAHGGRAHPYSIPYAFEGHINQFLAILSMSGLPLDHQFATATGPITMRDMLTNAQRTVNDKEEITWTLWALSRYLPPDAQWRNSKGEHWSIEKLVKLQVDKPLQGAPCGGTHGLFALAHARNVYLRRGEPLRGVWLEAEHKIRKYISTARIQQNSDGTLSSNFFRGREYKQDFDKRMASAGHVLEFLMIAMPQEELSEPWVRKAIEATCNDLMNNRHEYVSCSPLYHTVNGLSIYLERVAAAGTPANLATGKEKTRTISMPREVKTADADSVSRKEPSQTSSDRQDGSPDNSKAGPQPQPVPVPVPLTIPSVPEAAPSESTKTPAPTQPSGTPSGGKSQELKEESQKSEPQIGASASVQGPVRLFGSQAVREKAAEPMPVPVPLLTVPPMPDDLSGGAEPGQFEVRETQQIPALRPVPMDDDSARQEPDSDGSRAEGKSVTSPAALESSSNRVRTVIRQGSPGHVSSDGRSPGNLPQPPTAGPERKPVDDGRKKKPQDGWKATAPERRRPIVVLEADGQV